MAKEKMPKTFLARSRSWAAKNGIFGPQAFLRYVMLSYLDALSQVSDDFVFKGGNLLWVYIETPRATVDLDLATLTMESHAAIKQLLEAACSRVEGIRYSVQDFKEVESEGRKGAAVTIAYVTDQGADNRFDVDVVYRLETDATEIQSPVSGTQKIRAATVENIIADKISGCHRFKSGNTRMKDFDDLWRLAVSGTSVDFSKLHKLLKMKSVPALLDPAWINTELERGWKAHCSRYKDLPGQLESVFADVNEWVEGLMGQNK